ncbi:MAG: hypothetical protein K9G49_09335 [Taibaiella sp.]|nr:hypothetical protein [Taibaiella sp.]
MRSIFTLILLSTLLYACGGDRNKWDTHSIPEGGFTIAMPSPISKSEKKEVTPFGTQIRHFVRWKPSNFAIDKVKLYEVSYTDCPASVMADSLLLQSMLDSAVDMRIKDFSEVEVLESQAIELNGYPGRAFFYDAPKGNTLVSVKICIAGGKLYDLVVIVKKNYSTNEETANFFNSFKLVE